MPSAGFSVIEIGQDANGHWAYIIWGAKGVAIGSDDYFDTAEMAMTAAVHEQNRLLRSGKLVLSQRA